MLGPEYTVLPLRVSVGVVLLALGVPPPGPLAHLARPPAVIGPGGWSRVWLCQFVFVIICHPQSFLPPHCAPPDPSTDRQGLEVRRGVRRDVRRCLWDFLHLKWLCFNLTQNLIELFVKFWRFYWCEVKLDIWCDPPETWLLSSVARLCPLRTHWRKGWGRGSYAAQSHRIVAPVNCVCSPSWLISASRRNDPVSWRLALQKQHFSLLSRKPLGSFAVRNWCKVRPENYQLTTETGRSKWKVKSFPKNLGERIRDIFCSLEVTPFT